MRLGIFRVGEFGIRVGNSGGKEMGSTLCGVFPLPAPPVGDPGLPAPLVGPGVWTHCTGIAPASLPAVSNERLGSLGNEWARASRRIAEGAWNLTLRLGPTL